MNQPRSEVQVKYEAFFLEALAALEKWSKDQKYALDSLSPLRTRQIELGLAS